MKKYIIIFFIALIGFIVSCRKSGFFSSTTTPTEVLQNYMTTGTTGSESLDYGVVSYTQINNTFGQTNDVVIAGRLEDGNGGLVNAGVMQINGLSIQPSSTNGYFVRLDQSDSLIVTQSFGTNISFQFSGNVSNVQPFASVPVRLPNTIYGQQIDLPNDRLPIGTPLVLNWSPDNSTIDRKMYIQVSYYKLLSQNSISSAPNEIQSIFYVVPDNGRFTISTFDLSRFPLGTYAGISMSRGYAASSTIIKRGKLTNFYSLAVVKAATIPLLVVQ